MSEENERPMPISRVNVGGREFVEKIQENIEAGKRNAPEILRLVALSETLNKLNNNS